MTAKSDLYERLGGEAAVEAAAVRFYRKVVADSALAPFFVGYDLRDQMEKHIVFLMTVFGGRSSAGPDLTKAHAPLVARGLGHRHVDAFVRIMREVLAELDVAEADAARVLDVLESARPAVLAGTPRSGGGSPGGSASGGGGEHGGFDLVVVDEGKGERRMSSSEFLGLPLGERVTFVVRRQARFFLGAEPVDADAALASARKRRASLTP